MKRGVTLVSVAITAFSVVIMASVVYGYRVSASPKAVPQAAPVLAAETRPSPELVSESSKVTTRIAPMLAAGIASEFLGRTDAFSVELAQYNGLQAYKVTFTSGNIVYVSPDGQILGSELPTTQLASLPSKDRDDHDDRSGDDDHHDDDHEEHEEEHEEGG